MSDSLFHVVDDCFVILRTKAGIYRQAKVFRRGDRVYAGHSGGFVRLMSNNGTSCPTISWEEMTADERVAMERLGPRYVAPLLPAPETAKLIEAAPPQTPAVAIPALEMAS